MKKYTTQNPILKTADSSVRNKLDARYTEIPCKSFPFSFTIHQDLNVGDTIELVRLPMNASIIQYYFENTFDKVQYKLETSLGDEITQITTKKVSKDSVCSIDCSKESVILKVIQGSINKGDNIKGYVIFTAR